MGQLTAFNVDYLIQKYNLKIYFETGTGEAISLMHALDSYFEFYYSVDLDEELIIKANKKIINSCLKLIHNYSSEALKEYVPTLEPDKPVLFFLDAHFPGADFHKCTYEESIRQFKQESFPLETELNTIFSLRDTSKDVIIIDDFKLFDPTTQYEDSYNPIQHVLDEIKINTNPDFIYKLFEKTHTFEKKLNHQGYLSILPINK